MIPELQDVLKNRTVIANGASVLAVDRRAAGDQKGPRFWGCPESEVRLDTNKGLQQEEIGR